ncbi:response regulator [Desulfococcaceae bacterium HSG8]|nr:response regulator [Desulfococcaceae bacterium HSG8]
MNEQTTCEPSSDILIVDDKPENLRLLSGILKEKGGYTVRILRKGRMVPGSVIKFPPDIILLDIMMPDMDGYEVCRQLKTNEQTCDIPVIFISALDETTDKVKGFNLGGVDYIVKPFQEEEVLARVKMHLNLCHMRKQLEAKNIQLKQEIESRKQIEKKLTMTKGFLDNVINTMSNPVFVKDEQHRWLILNDAYCRFMGYDREELIGKSDYDFFSREEADVFWEKDNLVFESGKTHTNEERFTDSSGKNHTILTQKSVMTNETGEKTLVGIITDITDLKRARECLEAESEFRAGIIKFAAEGICVCYETGGFPYLRFSEWNDRMTEITGYTMDEINRSGWYQTMHPDHDVQQKAKKRVERMTQGDQLEREEWEITAKDGKKRVLSISTSTVVTGEGTPCTLAVMHDLTDTKKTEQELFEAKNAADAANRAKSNFLANMSHEIRTPMNSVLGFIELALELRETHRTYLTTARNSARSLLKLINDILDVSKLESGHLELENIPFNLHKTVEDALCTLNLRAKEKGLFLKLSFHEAIPRNAIGDPSRLRQILINLAGNAIKFTEKGGVTVHVSPQKDSGVIRFSIADTGIGIPGDSIRSIFAPFAQADASTTRRFGGTGLGTTISKQLAELMGGEIWAESEEGKGSTFHFTIFTEPTDIIPEPESEGLVSGSGRCFRVLVAEDIEENIILAKIRLGEHGHTVFEARNGREAAEWFQRESPDIILMDVHMPETDGLEAARMIRELEADSGSHIPIIALTASVMKEEQKICLEAGMDAVAGKPVDFEELFILMEQLVPEGAGSPAVGSQQLAVGSQQSAVGSQQSVVGSQQLAGGSQQSVVGSQHFKGIDIEKGLRIWQDSELYQKALLGFCRDYGNAADKILNSVRAGDREDAYRIAHALKGVAGNLSITKVYSIVTKLSVALGEKDTAVLIPLIESLALALNSAVASIRQLAAPEPDYNSEEKPESPKDPGSFQKLRGLFRKLLNSFEEYNPAAAEPFLEELSNSLSQRQTGPIRKEIDRFDFDEAREQTVKLAADLGIQL